MNMVDLGDDFVHCVTILAPSFAAEADFLRSGYEISTSKNFVMLLLNAH